jgi:hypothetical protein
MQDSVTSAVFCLKTDITELSLELQFGSTHLHVFSAPPRFVHFHFLAETQRR